MSSSVIPKAPASSSGAPPHEGLTRIGMTVEHLAEVAGHIAAALTGRPTVVASLVSELRGRSGTVHFTQSRGASR